MSGGFQAIPGEDARKKLNKHIMSSPTETYFSKVLQKFKKVLIKTPLSRYILFSSSTQTSCKHIINLSRKNQVLELDFKITDWISWQLSLLNQWYDCAKHNLKDDLPNKVNTIYSAIGIGLWLIDCFVFYAVSAIFQPCHGGIRLWYGSVSGNRSVASCRELFHTTYPRFPDA